MSSLLRIGLILGFLSAGIAGAFYVADHSAPRDPAAADRAVAEAASPTNGEVAATQLQPAKTIDQPNTLATNPLRAQGSQWNLTLSPQLAPAVQPQVFRPYPAFAQQVPAAGVDTSKALDTMLKIVETMAATQQPVAPLAAREPAPELVAQVTRPAPEEVDPGTAVNIDAEGDGRLSMSFQDASVREVLELLSAQSGLNILTSSDVQGTISASLTDVGVDTALEAILRSSGLTSQRDGNILFVGTAREFQARDQARQHVRTRLYRPNYVRAAELQSIITPLLSPNLGTVTVSSAAETGIASNSSEVGGDGFADAEVVLVRDLEGVLDEIDVIFKQVDRRPLQVSIEAMILSVTLDDQTNLGVNFELLRDKDNIRLVSGTPPTSLGSLNFEDGGMKIGFLDSSAAVLVEALETVGDTNVIASPRLLVLNKHRAEILIGSQLGYVSTTVTETATTQSVEFLEVGTQLRLRPFISDDGMVRMEIHPELSTGKVTVESGFTLPDKEVTEVTTNIMARDGSTVIIGGLIREELGSSASQIPLFGSLPLVGNLFRNRSDTLERKEIIVLITPRILYEPDIQAEGDHSAAEFHHRQSIIDDKLSPLGKRTLGKRHFRLAQEAWANGNQRKAMHHINRAIFYNPQSRAAIDLRTDIFEGKPFGDHHAESPFLPSSGPQILDAENLPGWILEDVIDDSPPRLPKRHPRQPGTPGRSYSISNQTTSN